VAIFFFFSIRLNNVFYTTEYYLFFLGSRALHHVCVARSASHTRTQHARLPEPVQHDPSHISCPACPARSLYVVLQIAPAPGHDLLRTCFNEMSTPVSLSRCNFKRVKGFENDWVQSYFVGRVTETSAHDSATAVARHINEKFHSMSLLNGVFILCFKLA